MRTRSSDERSIAAGLSGASRFRFVGVYDRTMTILVAGDTHGDQRWLGCAVERLRPTALIHLGISSLRKKQIRHWPRYCA